MKKLFQITPLLILISLLCSCNQPEPISAKTADATTYFPIAIDGKTAYLQIAMNTAEQTKGLMHRDSLEPDHGMLFLFEQPKKQRFWMRNTKIPLDLAYYNTQAELEQILKLYPFDETPARSKSDDIQIVIEMNQGWYTKNQIRPQSSIDLQALKKAVGLRGFDTNKYNLW